MKTKNLKALSMSLILTIGSYSVCPSFMFLQSRDFAAKVAALKNNTPKKQLLTRTLAVLERN